MCKASPDWIHNLLYGTFCGVISWNMLHMQKGDYNIQNLVNAFFHDDTIRPVHIKVLKWNLRTCLVQNSDNVIKNILNLFLV